MRFFVYTADSAFHVIWYNEEKEEKKIVFLDTIAFLDRHIGINN